MADIIFWKADDFHITLYPKVFEVADYEFDIVLSGFKMAGPTWQTQYGGHNILDSQRFSHNSVLQDF